MTAVARAERGALVMGLAFGAVWVAEALGAGRVPLLALCSALPHLPLLVLPVLGLLVSWTSRAGRAALGFALLALLLALWSGLNIPLGRRSPDGPSLRLATFNVHGLAFGADAVRGALQETGADVVCLQEVHRWNLEEALYPGGRKGWYVANSGELAVLSRYPVLDWQELELCDPEVETRPAVAVRLQAPGGPITVLNTHWTLLFHPGWARGGLAGLPTRLEQTTRLRQVQAQRLNEVAATLPRPVLIAGDFNGDPRDPAVRRALDGRVDAFAEAGWGFGYTFAADLPLVRIDHVMAPRGWSVESARVVAGIASDHRPLVVRLAWPRVAR